MLERLRPSSFTKVIPLISKKNTEDSDPHLNSRSSQLDMLEDCIEIILLHFRLIMGIDEDLGLIALIQLALDTASREFFYDSDIENIEWTQLSLTQQRQILDYLQSIHSQLKKISKECVNYFIDIVTRLGNRAFQSNIIIQFDQVNEYLSQRQLLCGNQRLYALEVIYSYYNKASLDAVDDISILSALTEFNETFSTTILDHLGFDIKNINKHSSADGQISRELLLNISDHIIVDSNLSKAILTVYSYMSSCRDRTTLLSYHTLTHAIGVMESMWVLLLKSELPHELTYIAILCSIFHDSEFTNSRISDEVTSVYNLLTFIKPILNQLQQSSCEIICRLIYQLLCNATTPCFVDKNTSGYSEQNIISLADLISDFVAEKGITHHERPLLSLPLKLIKISDVFGSYETDIVNTVTIDISQLMRDSNCFYLDEVYENTNRIAVIVRLAQAILNIAEQIAKNNDKRQLAFSIYVNRCQGYRVGSPSSCLQFFTNTRCFLDTWKEIDIQKFALNFKNGIFSESNFLERIENGLKRTFTLDEGLEEKLRQCEKYRSVLNKIHEHLTDKKIPVSKRREFVKSLASLEKFQIGKSFNIASFYQISNSPTSVTLARSNRHFGK